MSDCYCDYDPATIYSATNVKKSRKQRACEECGRKIRIGEPYENVFMVYDGMGSTFATCQHCFALRSFIQISTPCFCFIHGGVFENLKEHLENCFNRSPDEMRGVRFRAGRFAVEIRREVKRQRIDLAA
jgi:hypothetical protein